MKIISHSADADGWTSAFLVARHFKITDPDSFIMTDYGKHDDIFSKIEKDEQVFVCDFSFENGPEDMKKLLEITKNVTWIDHHESSIKAYGDFGKDIPGLRVNGTAACMLVWVYLHLYTNKSWRVLMNVHNTDDITQQLCEKLYSHAPKLVLLVHDNDVWRHDYPESKYFKLGLDMEDMSDMNLLDRLYRYPVEINQIVENGKIAAKYRDSIGEFACNEYGFECTINGKKGFALNTPFRGSPWFGDLIKKYDFICPFARTKDGQWSYSFYSDPENGANCYEIAKSINPKGGGHYHAAGCTSDKLIF